MLAHRLPFLAALMATQIGGSTDRGQVLPIAAKGKTWPRCFPAPASCWWRSALCWGRRINQVSEGMGLRISVNGVW